MKYTLLSACLLFAIAAIAQDKSNVTTIRKANYKYDTAINGVTYSYVDKIPEPGIDLSAYLAEYLHYPDNAKENNIEGSILIQFMVNVDGSTSDYKVIKGESGGCAQEAIRVIKSMPSWKPAMREGKPVKSWYSLPIKIKPE